MKQILSLFILLTYSSFAHAQSRELDSLNNVIKDTRSDTQRINLSIKKINALENFNLDSAISFGITVIQQAQNIKYGKGEVGAKLMISYAYAYKGEYATATKILDDVKIILDRTKDSSSTSKMYNEYGVIYSMQTKYDSSLSFYNKAIVIATALKDFTLMSTINQNIGIAYQQQSQFPQALRFYQKALSASEKQNDREGIAYICLNMGITFTLINDTARSIQYLLKSVNIANDLNLKTVACYAYANLASLYGNLKDFDKEYDYGIKAATLAQQTGDQGIQASSLSRAASALAYKKNFAAAEKLCRQSMQIADSSNQPLNIYQTYAEMGDILKKEGKCNDAIPLLEKALHLLSDADLYDFQVASSYLSLSSCYEQKGDYNKALSAFKTASLINDTLQNKQNIRKATELALNYEFDKKQQLQKAEQARKDADTKRIKNQQYFIITALGIVVLAVVIIASIQFKNNRQKQRAYNLLQQQKKQTDGQRQKAEDALSELKSTQTQLIHSEKMASLGELTAGIAHEIQNPLNFVTNFSEISNEMIDEMKEELATGNMQLANEMANNIKLNLEKINHHGKRADAIVKGMLLHSRKSTGRKELADINNLCFEYARLSYHTLRAKEKSFHAELKTDFDASIEKINIVPQDIGRAVVNLVNNAFYAVDQKRKMNEENYQPEVWVQTKKINDGVQIIISDNGSGIPENIIGKIFQPFFTTKPTGEGTGLGLSLTYDFITKEHNGTIKAESKTGEGTKFIITLPA